MFTQDDGWDTVLDAGVLAVDWDHPSFEGEFPEPHVTWFYERSFGNLQLALTRDMAQALLEAQEGGFVGFDNRLQDYLDEFGGNAADLPLANDFAQVEKLVDDGLLNADTVEIDVDIRPSDLHFAYGSNVTNGVQRQTLDISWGDDRGIHVVLPNADDAIGFGVERFAFQGGATVLSMADMIGLANGGTWHDPRDDLHVVEGTDDGEILVGGDGHWKLIGHGGNDELWDDGGIADMDGGSGDDTFYVTNSGDTITENVDEGTDLVQSSVDWTLGDNVENLTLNGTDALVGVGNALDNVLYGNGGADTLSGGDGNDTLFDGGGSAKLIGGTGDDLYLVYNANTQIVEQADEGIDTVQTAVDYALGANVENLTVVDDASVTAIGNDLGNILTANNAGDLLDGQDGDDELDGGDGDDTLIGGAGDDSLYGSLGANLLEGGLGDDSYLIDSAGGNTIVENAGEGTDTVYAFIDYTLGANLEDLTLLAGAARGTGNELDNTLVGDELANELSGEDGNDVLLGAEGDDTLLGGNGNDRLDGGSGNDVLDGGAGNDTYLFGRGDGQDVIALRSPSDPIGAGTLQFKDGVSLEDLRFLQVTDPQSGTASLQISIAGTDDSIMIAGYFLGDGSTEGSSPVKQLKLGDDTVDVRYADGSMLIVKLTAADGSSVSQWTSTDGTSGTDTLDATGAVFTHAWTHADGASGTDDGNTVTGERSGSRTYASGESSTYDILRPGNGVVEEKDTSVDAAGNTTSHDTITQADGSYVKHVTLGDGSFENETFDAATGEDSGTSHLSGDAYTRAWDGMPLAGGSRAYDQILTYADGSTYATHQVTQADGSRVSNWASSDGSSGIDRLDATGAAYTHAWTHADGSSGADNGNTVTGERMGSRANASGESSTYDILQLGDGAVEEIDTTIDAAGNSGSYDTVTQPDGSFVKHVLLGNGSFANETFDAASGEDSGSVRQPGDNYTRAWDHKPLADGSDEYDQTLSFDDGSSMTTEHVTRADGASSTTWSKSDGRHGVDFVGAAAGAGDAFSWGVGGGDSTLRTASGNDSLQLGGGVASDDLWFRQDRSDLEISIMGTTDKLDIQDWFNGSQLQSISLATGETLVRADVQQLVDAMAQFAAPDASQLEYTAPERSAITPVIAANWH
jgi:Ca2+-binding RTX toxin-like protein